MTRVNCFQCRRDMDERVETVWQYTTGWAKKRDQGGTNYLALRTSEEQFCCNGCMQLMLSGLDPGQQSLGV